MKKRKIKNVCVLECLPISIYMSTAIPWQIAVVTTELSANLYILYISIVLITIVKRRLSTRPRYLI